MKTRIFTHRRGNYRLNDPRMHKIIVERERERQRKFYEFFTVVYVTHMSRLTFVGNFYFRNLSLEFYFPRFEKLTAYRLTNTFRNHVCCLQCENCESW